MIQLGSISIRSLEFFAQAISGKRCRVMLSSRAEYPVTVVLNSNTIVLSPDAGLWDLALASRCWPAADHLKNIRSEKPGIRSRAITGYAHKRIIPNAQSSLLRQYPRLQQAGGFYLPGESLDGFRVTEEEVHFSPLPDWQDSNIPTDFSFEFTSGLGIHGIEEDTRKVMSAIKSGQVEWEIIPGLAEFPVKVVRFTTTSPVELKFEHGERIMTDPDVVSTMNSIHRCVMNKAESLEDRIPRGSHLKNGLHLDHTRLVPAAIAALNGNDTSVKLFRNKSTSLLPNFNPRQMLICVNFDLNDVCSRDIFESFGEIQKTLLGFLQGYAKTEADMMIEFYADQMVKLDDGRKAIIQFRTRIKDIDEPLDDAMWNRIREYLGWRPKFPGRPTHFHPLAAREIAKQFREVLDDNDKHIYRLLFWMARSAPTQEFPIRNNRHIYERFATSIDQQFESLLRDIPAGGTFDTEPVLLPKYELIRHGQPGGFLSRTYFGKND
jgi:hypothetical protein